MNRIPVSLIVDDGGPVNMYFFHDPGNLHELLVPPAFAAKFAAVCSRCGIKGKFSFVPMPAGLGRIDGKVCRVPNRNIREYIRIFKDLEPSFSITPEILTHYRAFDLKTGRFMHIFEDVFFSRLTAAEITDYVGLALTILSSAGLTPAGVTSPWLCGIDNEKNYAAGIGMAFKKVMGADRCFYFLHTGDELNKPVLMNDSAKTGRVVSIPGNTFDPFWNTQNPVRSRIAKDNVRKNIDRLLSPDGKSGRIRELYEQGLPITLLTHWQSLYSDGREIGLKGLETLAKRINKIFGKQVEWMSFAELADNWNFSGN